MPAMTSLTDQELHAIAETVLRHELADVGFDHVETRAGDDHDGDPSLFVVAVMRPSDDILPAATYNRAYRALDETLQANGESRFPYFRVEWIGDEATDEELAPDLP